MPKMSVRRGGTRIHMDTGDDGSGLPPEPPEPRFPKWLAWALKFTVTVSGGLLVAWAAHHFGWTR